MGTVYMLAQLHAEGTPDVSLHICIIHIIEIYRDTGMNAHVVYNYYVVDMPCI